MHNLLVYYFYFFFLIQIEMRTVRGQNNKGFIAIDFLDLLGSPNTVAECEFTPPDAKPKTTTVTSTPSTTPQPTEPPGFIFCDFEKDYCDWNR